MIRNLVVWGGTLAMFVYSKVTFVRKRFCKISRVHSRDSGCSWIDFVSVWCAVLVILWHFTHYRNKLL